MAFFKKQKQKEGEKQREIKQQDMVTGVFLVIRIHEDEPIADVTGITTVEETARKWAKRDKATPVRVI